MAGLGVDELRSLAHGPYVFCSSESRLTSTGLGIFDLLSLFQEAVPISEPKVPIAVCYQPPTKQHPSNFTIFPLRYGGQSVITQ